MAESKPSSPKLEPHPLVAALQADPAKPPARTIKLVGFPGKSPQGGTSRLWLDSDLVNYVDIPDAAIRHTQALANNGGTVVWVDADAKIAHGSTHTTTANEFLSGGIAGSHLAGAAAGAPAGIAAAHPNAITLNVPCVTNGPPCPTLSLCPSHFTPCSSLQIPCVASHTTPCLASLNVPCVTHTTVCQPSHLIACHSVVVQCPVQTAVCPTLAACPSHVTVCPSHTLCPSVVICATHTLACTPSVLCPSHIACPTLGGCPSLACPSLACGTIGNPGEEVR